MRGLGKYEGAPTERIRAATRLALGNLVDLALNRDVAMVLIAGDLYDGDWDDFDTGLFFANQMSRLREAHIPVFVVAGNHDAANRITPDLPLPSNVHMFPSHEPSTQLLDDLGIAIHGQSYSQRVVTGDLSRDYPKPISDLLNVGLLHTSADGRPGHDTYAPCTPAGLVAQGYDYWALGHVHTREVVNEDPWIVFPGNLQGRHIRETGPKGCTLVEVEDGSISRATHQEVDVVRWDHCHIDATNCTNTDEVLEAAILSLQDAVARSAGRMVAARVEVTGCTAAHGELNRRRLRWENQLRARATDLNGDDLWLEKVRVRTRPVEDVQRLMEREDALGGVLRAVTSLQQVDGNEWVEEFKDLRTTLPAEFGRSDEWLQIDDPKALTELLGEVKELLLSRLLDPGDEA
ncbi:MAG TPA: DNA repair exonuclease [Deltaproteobacteria bacterium]|nr:DNA repair exonuclease [Deltaproteobacteria bacterium]HCP47305.1 DNA repair exonuclease [Deltaproteobacteria bacterium]